MSVALVTRHAKHMRHFVVCGLSGCNTLSHKRHDFLKEGTELKMSVLISSATFV